MLTRLRAFFNLGPVSTKKPTFAPEIDPSMKFLIVGLGNPGAKYEDTRHNIGFRVVEKMAGTEEWESVNHGDIARVKHRGKQIILLKPNTYMNLSGKAVRYWMQQEKIDKQNLLVVVDDLHLDYAKVRLRGKGSDAGHNGLKSIDSLTGGNNYARLRCGIGNDFHPGQQADYVLSEWTNDEFGEFAPFLEKCSEVAFSFCAHGLANTMSKYNNK